VNPHKTIIFVGATAQKTSQLSRDQGKIWPTTKNRIYINISPCFSGARFVKIIAYQS